MAAWGLSMRGSVRSRQKCPVCGARGQYSVRDFGAGRRVLLCQCGGFASDRPEIVLRWQGKQLQITNDTNGNRFRTLEHCERSLGLIRNQIEAKSFYPESWAPVRTNRLLWQNYLRDYLAREQQRCRLVTYRNKAATARHLAWFNGRNIREIRTADIADFAALPCLQLALHPQTRQLLLNLLRQVFRDALRREDIERLPLFPSVDVPQKTIQWMLPEQQSAALVHLPQRHQPIFRFLMLYGCRVGEACALCWDAIDREKGVLYFKRTISADRVEQTTKTRRERPLPIFDAFAAYLDSIPPGIGQTPVFKNPDADWWCNPERRYTGKSLNAYWRKALEDAGLPHVKLYNAARHSRGMQALNMDGWGLDAVQMLLGHTNAATTKKYAQPEVALLKQLMDGNANQTASALPAPKRPRTKRK